MPRLLRTKPVYIVVTTGVILALAFAIACQGELDPGFLENQSRLSATSTAIAQKAHVANVKDSATAIAAGVTGDATQVAGESTPSMSTSEPVPTVPVASQPGDLPGTISPAPDRIRPGIDSPTPGPTVEIPVSPTPVPQEEFTPDPAETATIPETPEPVFPAAVYGPFHGDLPHLQNGDDAEQFALGVNLDNFVVSATFVNPFDGRPVGVDPATDPRKSWSIGLWVRVERSPAIYRNRGIEFPGGERSEGVMLVIQSTGRWELFHRDIIASPHGSNIADTLIQTGAVGGLNIELGQENNVAVAVYGESGAFMVNGVLAGDLLDMSSAQWAGDVLVLSGVNTNDEFAGTSTVFHSVTIAESGAILDVGGPDRMGPLLAGAAPVPFTDIAGDFILDAWAPVTTPIFSGAWSWQLEMAGETEQVVVSIDSARKTVVTLSELMADGITETTSVFNSTISTIGVLPGDVNKVSVVMLNGQLGILVNGLVIPGVAFGIDEPFDVTVNAFVRGEASSSGAIVQFDTLRLWQPAR